MFRQRLDTLKVATRTRGFVEITRDIQSCVERASVHTGLCTLHLRHTSAPLLIQENADPDVRRDFERFYVWEHRTTAHTRTVVVHVIGEEE